MMLISPPRSQLRLHPSCYPIPSANYSAWCVVGTHHFMHFLTIVCAFPVAQMVKSLPAMQETWVQPLDWEDALEKEMATHSSILAWEAPWTKEPGGLESMGSQRVRHDWATNIHPGSTTRPCHSGISRCWDSVSPSVPLRHFKGPS